VTELPPPQASAPPSPPPPTPTPPPAYTPTPAVSMVERKTGPGLLVRAIWFVFVGWWATAIVSAIAWVAMITIIGLPLGIWLVNRIPTVLTLRPRTSYVTTYTDALGRAVSHETKIDQPPWYVRGLWFVFVGWWLSGVAMSIGWVLCVLIITLPLGLMVYNRVPFLASLYRY
jgi:uncharacterized membrane protein YccF (DUF307 family)